MYGGQDSIYAKLKRSAKRKLYVIVGVGLGVKVTPPPTKKQILSKWSIMTNRHWHSVLAT